MKSYSLYFVILSLTYLACDSGVSEESIEPNNLISVTSFISPQDTLLSAYIYYAQKLGTNINVESSAVDNALVLIADDQSADTLSFIRKNLRYEGQKKNLYYLPNKTYTLKIILPNGKTLFSECTIPPYPETPVLDGIRNGNDFLFTVNWNNINQHPYFILSSVATGTYEVTNPRGTFTASLISQLDKGSFIMAKQNDNNSETGVVTNAYLSTEPGLNILLRNIDLNMYMFYDTYGEFDDWNSNTGNLIPNFRDPKPIYSNIIGGVGVFGAYNVNIKDFEIN
jgi:hypothetical protein